MPLPSDALTIANLLRIAAQDLDGSKHLAAAGNRNAPYLCQQAAEKVARAVAHPEGQHLGREHRIDVIVDFLPAANPMRPLLKPLEELTPYATTYLTTREVQGMSPPRRRNTEWRCSSTAPKPRFSQQSAYSVSIWQPRTKYQPLLQRRSATWIAHRRH